MNISKSFCMQSASLTPIRQIQPQIKNFWTQQSSDSIPWENTSRRLTLSYHIANGKRFLNC